MEFHPLADTFPMMSAEEYAALKADIAANGLRDPIIRVDGKIIDGRNRYNACVELGIEPKYRLIELADDADMLRFIVSMNLYRRHLSQAQKREVGQRLLEMTDWSDSEIARRLAVNQSTVSRWHDSLSHAFALDATRTVTRGGTTYTMDVSSIGRSLEADETSVESSRPDWWQSSEEDDWWTPQWLFDLVDAEIGFEIDVCASDANRKCVKYFTREHDGLAQEWTGKCWMNPPYGRSGGVSIYDWIEKAYASAKQGATVACLIPARTDTLWWWDFCIHGEIRFLKGRLRFENSNTIAPFPSAVVIFWPFVPVSKAKVIWWDVKDGHES